MWVINSERFDKWFVSYQLRKLYIIKTLWVRKEKLTQKILHYQNFLLSLVEKVDSGKFIESKFAESTQTYFNTYIFLNYKLEKLCAQNFIKFSQLIFRWLNNPKLLTWYYYKVRNVQVNSKNNVIIHNTNFKPNISIPHRRVELPKKIKVIQN